MPLPESITVLVAQYVSSDQADSAQAINQGLCEGFAADLLETHPEVEIVDVEAFMTGIDGDPQGCEAFDWQRLARHWNIQPPSDMAPADIDKMVIGGHVWVTDQGRHFDAECPEGKASFFDLPFFQRQIARELERLQVPHVASDAFSP